MTIRTVPERFRFRELWRASGIPNDLIELGYENFIDEHKNDMAGPLEQDRLSRSLMTGFSWYLTDEGDSFWRRVHRLFVQMERAQQETQVEAVQLPA